MDLDTLWAVADRARGRSPLSRGDVSFVRDVAPQQLDPFPKLKLPARVRHPAGFSISGASVGTFVRSALLIAGQKALGRRFGGSEFYEGVEKDLAFGIMRSHFHNGYPKGVYCCVRCTAGGGSRARRGRDWVLRLSRDVQVRHAPRAAAPVAICEGCGSTTRAVGVWRTSAVEEIDEWVGGRYQYVVPLQDDAQAALDALRADVFARGDYYGSETRPRNIKEAVARSGDSGTRSILDIERVAKTPDYLRAAALTAEERRGHLAAASPRSR